MRRLAVNPLGLLFAWSGLLGWGLLVCAALAAAEPTPLPPALDRPVDFVQDVQPIFSKTCYSCHGSEDEQAGLRLDLKRRALEGGDGGRVIVPGKSAESRLLAMVSGLDEEIGLMPPEGEGTPLTTEQVAILRTWIDQGAVWPERADRADAGSDHWSLQPITRPAVPPVQDAAWLLNPIDAFILERLEAAGIAPSPSADRATLIRRVYLDLLGLLPSPAQLQQFLDDPAPDAYERMVASALASPHYGERWGRHWLDLARYADSDGYEKDRARPHAWRYRNWVIDALNQDLSFEEFSVQQIAGDLLAEASLDHRVASGFHRNTLHNTEGGTDKEEDRVKKTVDRTNTAGTIWLGLTVGCAQCHSHKYDPLTQREYYQLYAFFNDIDEVDIDAPLPVERARLRRAQAAFERERAELQAQVKQYQQTKLAAAQRTWEETALESALVWRNIQVATATSKHGAKLEPQADASLLATGTNKTSDVYTVTTEVGPAPVTAVRLEALPDDSLVKKGPGRAENGNFVLSTFRVAAAAADGAGEAKTVKLVNAKADFAQQEWAVAKTLNDNASDGWAVSPQFGQRHVAVFEFEEPVSFAGGTRLTFTLDQTYKGDSHNLGRFRLSFTTGPLPATLEGLPASVAAALQVAAEDRTPEQQQQIGDYYRTVDPELTRLQRELAAHQQRAPKSSGVKAQAVVRTSQPRQASVHIRGNFLNKGDPVAPATPHALHNLDSRGKQPDRLDFARWLFADSNPLAARVTVNRVWQRIFGRGIVATLDDFGTQGDPPSHPELLDWLASEFRDQGWSLKELQRLILTSRTYRQAAAYRTDLAEVDPLNILLARQDRRRVEAEVIRDLALAASGLLESRVGGPSVRPRQPAEYSRLTYANSAKWQVSAGGDAYRRGLYTFFQRTSPYPMLMTFDSPDSTECCAQRSLSNTPLQALTLWNDPVFFECAQAFAHRVRRSAVGQEKTNDRVRQQAITAFQLSLARSPSAEELAEVIGLYESQLAWAQEDPARAEQLAGEPEAEAWEVAELAAWTVVGRTLLNLDEFITRE